MDTSELSDEQWQRLCPLLPPQKPRTGRPAKDHRTIINGILWLLRTGSPWRTVPETLRLVEDRIEPVLSLAAGRDLGSVTR